MMISVNKINKFFYIFGIANVAIPILIIIPALIFLSNYLKSDFEKYDYNLIVSKNYQKKAKIDDIKVRGNISINGSNPRVVSYSFQHDGKSVSDKFQTLEYEKVNDLKSKDSIDIYFFNNQSVIKDLVPFKFSIKIFWIIPILMIFFGFICMAISKSSMIQRYLS